MSSSSLATFSLGTFLTLSSTLSVFACSSGDDSSTESAGHQDAGGSSGSSSSADAGGSTVDGSSRVDSGNAADSSTLADSASDAGATPDGSGAAGCNAFADDSAQITVQAVTTAAPAPAGGTLVDGTYQITAATVYGSPLAGPVPGALAHGTLKIAGDQLAERSTVTVDGSTSTRDEVAVYTFGQSSTVSGADVCPANGGAATLSYTATDHSFVVFATGGDGAALTWTRIGD